MKRFYKDERGSSLVLTIIAMTFISLLAVAVISMTVTNIRLKIAQKGSQKNFYNTDSIMDEVRAGVEDLAAQAAMEAYMVAFSYYGPSQSGTPVDVEGKYKKKFLEEMIKLLSEDKRHYGDSDLLYKDEVLQSYLIRRAGVSVDRYIPHTGAADKGPGRLIDGKSYGYMKMENDTLLLKDIMITMTEGNKDYKTTLTSDIRVTVPPMTADTYSEYLNYALIADNQIIADANSSVNGSMYAGTVKRFDAGASNPETGILVHGGYTLNVKANNVVTRGDLVVNGGSKFFLDGLNGADGKDPNLWVENIFTSGNAKNTMKLTDVTCNVSDDMEVGGKNDDVTISGKYLGYNYNANYAGTELNQVSKDSQYSSAILINGMGANLNLSGLNNLILSGKTFISKKTDPGELSSTGGDITNPDIAMGESLSVKGAQIAYYVPSDFVTVTSGTTPSTGSSDDPVRKEFTFHITSDPSTEYVFHYGGYLKYLCGLDPQTATDADLNQELSAKGIPNFNLLSYLNTSQPLETYYRHNTAVEVNAITYFYLNFKSDTERMQFYPLFEKNFKRYATVKDTNAAYLGVTGIQVNNGGSNQVYSASGNILFSDPSSPKTVKIANEGIYLDTQSLQKYATGKSLAYMSMQLSLVENYQLAKDTIDNGQYRLLSNKTANLSKSGKKDKTNLYNVLINETEMQKIKDAGGGTVEKRIDVGGRTNDKAMVIIEPSTSTYVWDSSKVTANGGTSKGIIIAEGDVEVLADFSGLIIAGGDIKLKKDGGTVSADNVLLEDMFTEDKARTTNQYFFNLFSQYFQKAVNAAIGQEDDATQEVVFYEKWKKE